MRQLLSFAGVALVSAAVGGLLVAYLLPKPIDQPSPFYQPTPTELALDRAVPELRIDPMPLDAALAELGKTWGVEVTGNWASLEQKGLDRKAEVKLRARDVTLEEALDFLLRQRQSDTLSLGYSVQRAGLVVDLRDAVDAETLTRVYDVADVLRHPDLVDFYGTEDLDSSASSGPFSDYSPPTEPQDVLVELLTDAIDHDSWSHSGGRTGTYWLGSRLIISQTKANHRAIQEFLAVARQGFIDVEPAPDNEPRLRVWDDRLMRFVNPEPEQARWTLHGSIGRFWVNEMPMRSAIDLLAEQTGAPIFLDTAALEDSHFNLARPVTVHFPDATLYQALRAILRTPTDDRPVIGLDQGVIVITSSWFENELERADTQTRIFDIRSFMDERSKLDTRRARALFVEDVIRSVQEAVDTDSWRDMGGTTGAIVARDGWLTVTHTPENLRRVRQVLQELVEHPDRIPVRTPSKSATAPSPGER